ncbi:histidine kinase [Pseudomonas cichorii]|uniref:histidine kinase n=1 Tax=Pseudomonas cichorii TaxID=36746 RepID=UPI001C89E41F|nr:histidine kinase [Pseudomonas cichorii]MBX8497212.1 histidine kinase [Pseudomonas cichorii]
MKIIPSLKILIVEDEDSKLMEWKDAIEYHNVDSEKSGFKVEYESSKSADDAIRILNSHRFDAAVVDLRLQKEIGVSSNNSDGNSIVKYLIAMQPMGVAVYTGQSADAEVDKYESPQVKVMDKGDGFEQVFKWLKENLDLFLRLRGVKATYNRETAKVFYKSIWPRWQNWTETTQTDLTDVVARHIIAHVHDALLVAGGDVTHPEEAYFVPPMKSRLDTGDLVAYEGREWIVVSPRCDLANQGKVKTILIAACQDISKRWEELESSTSKSARDKLAKLVQHDGSPKQHFLLPMRDLLSNKKGPWLVQFDDICALKSDLAINQLLPYRFASLSPMFVPSLVERFGGYFSRIGTPGLSSD